MRNKDQYLCMMEKLYIEKILNKSKGDLFKYVISILSHLFTNNLLIIINAKENKISKMQLYIMESYMDWN